MVAGILILANLVMPSETLEPVVFKEGDIATRDIVAPFSFYVEKAPDVLERERQEAAAAVMPRLDLDPSVRDSALAGISRLFVQLEEIPGDIPLAEQVARIAEEGPAFSEATVGALRSNGETLESAVEGQLRDILGRGLILDRSLITPSPDRKVLLRTAGEEQVVDATALLDSREAANLVHQQGVRLFQDNERLISALVEVAAAFLLPNVTVDVVETNRLRKDAREAVPVVAEVIPEGLMIAEAHKLVTKEAEIRLRALEAARRINRPRYAETLSFLGRNVIFVAILGFMAAYLRTFRRRFYQNDLHTLLLAILAACTITLTGLVLWLEQLVSASISPISTEFFQYLVPVSMASILAAVLFDTDVAIASTIALSFLTGILTGGHVPGILLALTGGTVGAYTIRNMRRRSHFLRTMVYICLGHVAVISAIEFFRFTPPSDIARANLFGIANGVASALLAIGLLPIFEHLFGISTSITLLELSDLNHPLLRELAVRAPGSFHHSMVVGTLAEKAAAAIGANSLLARVGSYYHDVGKMRKPDYFVENQTGTRSPHDKLTPKMSSLVLLAHVKDGVELGKRAGLPNRIIDFIREHHGTTLMSFFYDKAKRLNPDQEIGDQGFRYPGPRPQSRETAILMLADSVEAAARSLETPTASRLKGLVRSILRSKFDESELDECELTMKDLHAIAASFEPTLIGVFHPRIEYPQQEATKKGEPLRGKRAETPRNRQRIDQTVG
jgi:putative nucleotidyltransferase with HDIG domain